ncbi:hypothetical protein CORC01_02671 [Colletotrichum orchidophilum]|uniref:Uncharacterized protein n=1 Tax=Colletotrichum orchidophilum TaxID=1209926 RepID=A0A1G4BKX3_9PEZI|nr:uncharacterized protein CORC01_02671 [Colletotrichum orchidophilum]OHF02092.1 hypothetical protein CORC01_02671 [Colletotrichum orchidophilum]
MFDGTKGCSSIDHAGSLVTLCNTESYQSICVDDHNGNINCNMTMGSTTCIDGDLPHFFLSYGSIAWLSNIIGFYTWLCIMSGNTPLNPNRKLKHKTLVCLGSLAYAIFLVANAVTKVPKMKNGNLKLIATGHVVITVIAQGAVLCLMKRNAIDDTEDRKNKEEGQADKDELIATVPTAAKDSAAPRPSAESAPSTTSTSTAVPTQEKTGFLKSFTSKITGVQTTKEVSATGDTGTDTPEKENTAAEGLASMVTGLEPLSLGHQIMLIGAVRIVQRIFVDRTNNETKQQRETWDSSILFNVVYGLILIINVVGILKYLSQSSTKSQDEENVNSQEREKRRAAEAKKARATAFFAAGMLAGLASDWCQSLVPPAVAMDNHGLGHLGKISNLSLVVLISSKLFVFAC